MKRSKDRNLSFYRFRTRSNPNREIRRIERPRAEPEETILCIHPTDLNMYLTINYEVLTLTGLDTFLVVSGPV